MIFNVSEDAGIDSRTVSTLAFVSERLHSPQPSLGKIHPKAKPIKSQTQVVYIGR